MLFFTHLGDAKTVALFFVCAVLFFLARRMRYEAVALAVSTFGSTAVVFALKYGIGRARPEGTLIPLDDPFSFPSGHSAIAVSFYAVLVLLLIRSGLLKFRRAIFLITFFLVLLIGGSRYYFNAHFLSDIFAGYGVGLLFFLHLYHRKTASIE